MIKEKIEKLRNELYEKIEKFGINSEEVKKISKKLDEVASQINLMQNENEYENIVEGRSKKIIIF